MTLLLTPVASEGTKPSNTMGVARRKATGEVFLTNQIVTLCGLDPSEAQVMDLLPTTTAMDYKASGGAEGTSNVTLTDALVRGRGLLPTPSANIGTNGGSQHPDKRRAGNHQPSIQDVAEHVLTPMLPTPRATRGDSGTETMYKLGAERSDEHRTQGEVLLLQTPSVADGTGGHASRSGERSNEKLLPGQARDLATNWGPYGPAVRSWEKVLGRSAPSPTAVDAGAFKLWRRRIEKRLAGKNRKPVGMRGSIAPPNPNLNPAFTEWMMGIPAGWITDIPITRNEQLKACGNGVVPQQAAAALKDMLAALGGLEEPAASDELPGQLSIYQELRP